MMKKTHFILCLLPFICLATSCTKEKAPAPVIYDPTPFEFVIPKGFPSLRIPDDNPATIEGIALGRMLYYDPIIDKTNERACGLCHVQISSFSSDTNSLPHINLAWMNAFLWNGKVEGVLEDIMLFEVEHFFQTDVGKLNANNTYAEAFKKAFNVAVISSREVAYALAQYVRSLASTNSKYDRFLRGEVSLTAEEEMGRTLFFSEEGDCFHCHGTILLTDNSFHNNGLDESPALGRMEITGQGKDLGKFKTPTLRNVEFTAPYMHDGRFASLEEVIDFYSEGVKWSPTVDPLMKQVQHGGVRLTEEEKSQLLAFLKTFSDTSFIHNPDFSDPF